MTTAVATQRQKKGQEWLRPRGDQPLLQDPPVSNERWTRHGKRCALWPGVCLLCKQRWVWDLSRRAPQPHPLLESPPLKRTPQTGGRLMDCGALCVGSEWRILVHHLPCCPSLFPHTKLGACFIILSWEPGPALWPQSPPAFFLLVFWIGVVSCCASPHPLFDPFLVHGKKERCCQQLEGVVDKIDGAWSLERLFPFGVVAQKGIAVRHKGGGGTVTCHTAAAPAQ